MLCVSLRLGVSAGSFSHIGTCSSTGGPSSHLPIFLALRSRFLAPPQSPSSDAQETTVVCHAMNFFSLLLSKA